MTPNALNLIFFAIALLCGMCAREYRHKLVWIILCLSAIVHFAANAFLFDRIDQYWEHIGYATIRLATLYLLFRAPASILQQCQIALILTLWATDWILYLDLRAETSLVYDQYERINLTTEAMQLALGANGVYRRIKGWLWDWFPLLVLMIHMGLVTVGASRLVSAIRRKRRLRKNEERNS